MDARGLLRCAARQLVGRARHLAGRRGHLAGALREVGGHRSERARRLPHHEERDDGGQQANDGRAGQAFKAAHDECVTGLVAGRVRLHQHLAERAGRVVHPADHGVELAVLERHGSRNVVGAQRRRQVHVDA